jgi:hypothetical protein
LEVVDHDQKRNRDAAQSADPPNAESKSASDLKNGPSTRHERSPRGTKRFSESSEAWRPRSFFQVLVFSQCIISKGNTTNSFCSLFQIVSS